MRALKLTAVTFLACAALALVALLPSRLCFKDAESYVFFTGDTSKNCREIAADGNADAVRLTLFNVSGECAVYPSLNLEKLLADLNGEVVFVEEIDGSVNYYCKADLPYSIKLYGEEINLHVCVKENSVKVASPIIFGGY